jgi:hypothetical protein
MNRVSAVAVSAAVILALAFFSLKLFSGDETRSASRSPGSHPGSSPIDGIEKDDQLHRDGRGSSRLDGQRPVGREAVQRGSRAATAGRGQVPSREGRGRGGAAGFPADATRSNGAAAPNGRRSADRRLSQNRGAQSAGEADHEDTDRRARVADILQGRGPSGGEDGDGLGRDEIELVPEQSETDESGKIFDPFSPDTDVPEYEEEPVEIAEVKLVDNENGVDLTEDSVLSFPSEGNVVGEGGTIDLVIEPNWNGTDEGDNTIVRVEERNHWENRIRLLKTNDFLRYMFYDNTGVERIISFPIADWQAGDPHQVSLTWGDAQLSMYVDGQLAGQEQYSGELEIHPGSTIELGSKLGDRYRGAAARISDLTIYDSPKSPGQF